jgi:hypothetical protein
VLGLRKVGLAKVREQFRGRHRCASFTPPNLFHFDYRYPTFVGQRPRLAANFHGNLVGGRLYHPKLRPLAVKSKWPFFSVSFPKINLWKSVYAGQSLFTKKMRDSRHS